MIRIIDDFEFRHFDEGNRKGIFIIYTVNGEYYTQSKIYGVDEAKEE